MGDWTIQEAYLGIWQIGHACAYAGVATRGRRDRTILRCDWCKKDLPQEMFDVALLSGRNIDFPVSEIVDDRSGWNIDDL